MRAALRATVPVRVAFRARACRSLQIRLRSWRLLVALKSARMNTAEPAECSRAQLSSAPGDLFRSELCVIRDQYFDSPRERAVHGFAHLVPNRCAPGRRFLPSFAPTL